MNEIKTNLNLHLYNMSKTTIHIGDKIKQKAKELRIGPTELGRLINTSKQNVYGIFKRKSIDTDLLRRISKVMNHDFFQYYLTDSPAYILMDTPTPYNTLAKTKNIAKTTEELQNEINRLKTELKNQEIVYLKKINEILEKKLGK